MSSVSEETDLVECKDNGKDVSDTKSKDKPVDRKVGYAAIKSEFLVPDYKPTLQVQYLSSEVKAKLETEEKSEEPEQGSEEVVNEFGKHKSNDNNSSETEPPSKKSKLKGRNKQRPRNERVKYEDKICPSIQKEKECMFGDNCKFNHDKKDYLAKKLPELDGPCHNFNTFGFCNYGVSCRFSKNHLSEDLSNLVNSEVYDKNSKYCFNALDDAVRKKLWKRKYNFQRADTAVKKVQADYKAPNISKEKKSLNLDVPEKVNSNASDKVDDGQGNELGGAEELGTEDSMIPLEDSGKKQSETVGGHGLDAGIRTMGCITDEEVIRVRPEEKKKIDFRNKLYLAPLTTVGNLPFRRVCKNFGVDVTCGEMALASQLLKGKASEWSLVKRHPCEDLFGVQVCGAYPDMMSRCAQLLAETCSLDFIDINCGCPIDLIFRKGAGSALMGKTMKLEQICRSMIQVMGDTPLTVKIRTGVFDKKNVAHHLIPRLRDAGVSLVTLHGRSREQRYTRLADWDYISQCAATGAPMPVFGNGDILSYEDANLHMEKSDVSGVMIARGALMKPWIFTEIKEQRHWDISSNERFDMLKDFANYGLEHWGSDHQGVENTRRFMLEWLSFLHRYIPVGVLERVPQRINERPPYYIGRNDLETLMASANCADWIKISEMLLGPVPSNFKFLPKHKANAYQ